MDRGRRRLLPGFNHFSRGPQGCPGTALALQVGRTAVRALLERGVEPASPKLNPEKPLPHMLDFFGARVVRVRRRLISVGNRT